VACSLARVGWGWWSLGAWRWVLGGVVVLSWWGGSRGFSGGSSRGGCGEGGRVGEWYPGWVRGEVRKYDSVGGGADAEVADVVPGGAVAGGEVGGEGLGQEVLVELEGFPLCVAHVGGFLSAVDRSVMKGRY